MIKGIIPRPMYVQIEEKKISWEEAISIGMELREMKDNSQWELGDLAKVVSKHYGQDSLGKFANSIGINKKSLQQYRRVAIAFPKNKRISYLSHRHHLILAAREDRFKWLKKAADNSWSVSQLQREIAIFEGKDKKEREVYRCPKCKGWVINTMNLCTCKKRGGK